MRIHSLFSACLALTFVSCGGRQTQDQTVLASRMADSVKSEWLKPHEALLSIRLDSDCPTEVLKELSFIYRNDGYYAVSTRADQLMTHPFERDYVVYPSPEQTEFEFSVSVRDTMLTARTILPHLLLDTRTRINLSVADGHLRILSSWQEDFTGDIPVAPSSVDSVCVGFFLSTDGRITQDYDAASIAVVIDTDGRHGKAVALTDAEGEWVFSSAGFSSGQVFSTLEGRFTEGILDLGRTTADSLESLFYCSTLPYPEYCAFSSADGYQHCQRLAARTGTERGDDDMLNAISLKTGCYVPSVSEMAALHSLLTDHGSQPFRCRYLKALSGAYQTSSESSAETSYSMDFTKGAVTGRTSKRYTPLRVRPFYLF